MAEADKDALKAAVNVLANKHDADVLILNYEILPPVDFMFMGAVAGRARRKNVVLILTTEGGSADSAFRMMRFLQAAYERIFIIVGGWCKSAGTLMCIGAHELFMGDLGELGPLDVQIVKADEMDEQKSGLVAEAAFEKLQQEAFKFFIACVRDFGASEYRVTLKTAAQIASEMTTSALRPIFDKLEPVTIGEDYRSNRLALAYAERLNTHAKNLKRDRSLDALENLLSGYPSHGFVIDIKEASVLFRNVKPLSVEMVNVVRLLSADAVMPRNRRQEQSPRLEFLNDGADKGDQTSGAKKTDGKRSGDESDERGANGRGNGSGQLPGNPKEGSRKKPPSASNGKASAN